MPLPLQTPLTPDVIRTLRAGQIVTLTGTVYTARDAAHRRLCACLDEGRPLPVDLRGQVLYYAGPCPPPPGRVIGAIGPTTSGRMDVYTPRLMAEGVVVTVGKGSRAPAVKEAIARYTGLYLVAVGGAAALMSRCVTASRVVAFEDLGTEAIREMTVAAMPLVVGIDCMGGDVYAR